MVDAGSFKVEAGGAVPMEPVETEEVAAEPLTGQAFAPYGRVLGRPARGADIEVEDWLGYWHALAEVGFERRPVWGWLEVRRRPMIIDRLERHRRAHEVFIPAGGVSLMAFATGGMPEDPLARPDPATLRVFVIDGSLSLVVGRGVWHAPAFAISAPAAFLLALEHETPGEDLEFRAVGPYRIGYTAPGEREPR